MSGRVLSFDQATHKVVDALLPWFVNGTLDAEERDLVQRHLHECTECEQQVEWLRDLHAACVAGATRPGASSAFDRLRHRLELPPGSALRQRTWRRRALRRSTLPWAAAAGVAVLVALATVWGTMLERPAAFHTLGAGQAAARPQGAIVVMFAPATSESELRRILRTAEVRIVDGPTATNGYVLDVATEREAQALQLLRSERAVVLAERLGPGPTR